MLLLNGSTTPLPQFASLSLVLNSDEHDERSVQMVSPLLTCAPLAFISHNQALQSLHELQFHLHSTIKAATEVSTEPEDQIAMGFFKEDARQMEDVQLFTPLAPAGLGVYYRLIRTDKKPVVQKIAQLILSAHKGSASSSSATPVDGVWGFVISVGIAGLPLVTMPSQAFYHVSERVNDIKEILTRRGDLDVNNVQTLLSTMLLLENDARMTNARMEQVRNVIVPEPEDTTGERKGGLISPLGVRRRGGKSANDDQQQREDAVLSLSTPPAEATRIVTEKLKVLSVAESQTLLQKYKRAAIERKASLDLTGGSSKGRFRRNRSMTSRDPDFDNFDYKGPSRGGPSAAEGIAPLGSSASVQSSFQGSVSSHSKSTISSSRQSLALRQPSKDTKLKAGMLSAPKNDAGHNRRRSNVTNSSQTFDEEASAATGAGFDPFSPSSAGGEEASVPGGQSRLQVNVALNEDLSCSYRQSQMSSCTVEGVVQVQVRASSQTAPFYLLLRDPTEQVDSFQENRKFADDVSSAILAEDDADRKYTISVPNGDNYFPVVRYKCVEDLRPVPIVRIAIF